MYFFVKRIVHRGCQFLIPKMTSSPSFEPVGMRFVAFFTVCLCKVIFALFFPIALWGWAGKCAQTARCVKVAGVPMTRVSAEQSNAHGGRYDGCKVVGGVRRGSAFAGVACMRRGCWLVSSMDGGYFSRSVVCINRV